MVVYFSNLNTDIGGTHENGVVMETSRETSPWMRRRGVSVFTLTHATVEVHHLFSSTSPHLRSSVPRPRNRDWEKRKCNPMNKPHCLSIQESTLAK